MERSQQQQPASPPSSRFSQDNELVGALIRLSDGREFALGVGITRIGRKRGSDLVLSDRTVSRHHADITYDGGRYTLFDHSSNGTWINGNLVAVAQPLRDGDCVKFGALEFRFRWVPASSVAGWNTTTGRLTGGSTVRMKGGKRRAKEVRRTRPRGRLRRVLLSALVLLLLAVGAGAVIYFYFPELADALIARVQTQLTGG